MNTFSKIFFLLFVSARVLAQGVCNITTGVERGGFTFDGPSSVCIGQEIKLKDISGGTDVKYVYGYNGENAAKLVNVSSITVPKWTFLAAGQYVILQYGKKNGKDMYYCDVVYVRENNKPDISYEACNNSVIQLTIRNSPANNFDSYRVKWGDGSIDNIPVGTILPYSIKKTFPPSNTQNLLVEGIYTIPNNCPAAQPITVKMDRGEMFPRIEKLELNEDGTEATITLKGNPDAEYNISSRSIDESGNPISFLPDKVKSGVFKMPITDKTKSQCFFVGRSGALCTEYSNEVCTSPFILKPIDDKNEISWQPIPTGQIQNTGVFTFINQVNNQIIREEGNNKTIFSNVNSPYIDNTADCSKKYCYTLSSKVTLAYAGYTTANYVETATVSQKQCINRDSVRPPALTDGFASVTPTNAVSINFTDNSSWTLDRNIYRLYRVESNDFKKIDSVLTVQVLTDAVDASQKSYCYQVSFVDKCDSESELSPAFCSVFLNQASNGLLQWSSTSPFGNTLVNSYVVQSFDELTNLPSIEQTNNPNEHTYKPILDNFEVEAKYRIKIFSADGKESFSNIFSIPIEIKLFLPDAFSPNSDNINDNLEVKGLINRIIDFEIVVYNRWGNAVFSSNSPLETWNGQVQNTLAPTDTYTYKIYAKLNDGKELKKNGKFVLLR
ncbi:hypothetical protein EMA8858_02889 [Emticicia aquatica]|uniref:Gliding motility-associated C-terminal domain-containing protein n=1 Tax=Emticicia aquatica TaxID=1681835 RepID=A0ABN8EYE8_9BACT|nr:gliding motility-associated C-terminal domain-containing protein [Emticicia aquatica]CAH0996754.1 hypothetical protein EMA8858_02889 [Emticicia aquatica]